MSGIYYTLILYTLQIYIYKTRETYQFDCIKKENDIYIYTAYKQDYVKFNKL